MIPEKSPFSPLICRDHLIAVLVLGKKQSEGTPLRSFDSRRCYNRVAVSLEKENLSEELKEREESYR
jgi:hypothetical protein